MFVEGAKQQGRLTRLSSSYSELRQDCAISLGRGPAQAHGSMVSVGTRECVLRDTGRGPLPPTPTQAPSRQCRLFEPQ